MKLESLDAKRELEVNQSRNQAQTLQEPPQHLPIQHPVQPRALDFSSPNGQTQQATLVYQHSHPVPWSQFQTLPNHMEPRQRSQSPAGQPMPHSNSQQAQTAFFAHFPAEQVQTKSPMTGATYQNVAQLGLESNYARQLVQQNPTVSDQRPENHYAPRPPKPETPAGQHQHVPSMQLISPQQLERPVPHQFEKELEEVKKELVKRDNQASTYEQRCESLTSKVDSLVKFLEEERAQRKRAECEAEQKQMTIDAQKLQIEKLEASIHQGKEDEKGLAENLRKLKDENDRLRREKVENLEEKQQCQFKVIDLESRLRATQKQLEHKEREFERSVREKYEA